MENSYSDELKKAMRISAGWIKFYAISMLVFSTLGILFSFYMFGFGFEEMRIGGLIMLIVCIVFIWIHSTLLQYAINLSNATSGSNLTLEKAFLKQKTYFTIIGVTSTLSLLYNLYNFLKLI